MNIKSLRSTGTPAAFAGILLALGSVGAQATNSINGISGTTFNLTAKVDHISTADA